MKETCLTKIEINLPINCNTIRAFKKIKNLFLLTEGIHGCTHSSPARPSILKGFWRNPKTEEIIEDDIAWICGCYDLGKADAELEEIINFIQCVIKAEGEKSAWITSSTVILMA